MYVFMYVYMYVCEPSFSVVCPMPDEMRFYSMSNKIVDG